MEHSKPWTSASGEMVCFSLLMYLKERQQAPALDVTSGKIVEVSLKITIFESYIAPIQEIIKTGS